MPDVSMQRIAVLGGGAWGTALAIHLARLGRDVTLWARDGVLVAEMAAERENRTYLPGVAMPSTLRPTADMEQALHAATCVVSAIPSHGTRGVIRQARAGLSPGARWSRDAGLCRTLPAVSEVIEEKWAMAALAGASGLLRAVARARPAVRWPGRGPPVDAVRGIPSAISGCARGLVARRTLRA